MHDKAKTHIPKFHNGSDFSKSLICIIQ